MFKRKLTALDFDNIEQLDVNDPKQFRNMIVWLEDRKIRHYKMDQRGALRATDSLNWSEAFQSYLRDLACPLSQDDLSGVTDWLLGYAIRLEYGDQVDKYKGVTADTMQERKAKVPKVVSTNPLDSLDFNDPSFIKGVEALAKILNVPKHPDHLVMLNACSRLVKNYLSPEAQQMNSALSEGKPFPIQEADLGFDTGDYVLNQAAKILRLLYIHDLRDLQTKINESIVAVQTITANPKTDTRLGKVGR
ncbi:unnamed protein product [Darwinula stevensoni]|uniref:RNA transcription, translation and transport factor protein n=1 Tax=Darwinula stevensoni TaxID=69355 RepID=A0A7R8X574_9CRUS|nr:unnamed protein product [Darwinula stevensoni]CAG0886812.1 unnamed protein product [Darwinula stevensoni]